MAKKTRDWQERLLKRYRVPSNKEQKEKSILNKKQLQRILKEDVKD